jgi:hypothetical protein
MTALNHTVEQFITDDRYTAFQGLDRLCFRIVLPDWHQPFPTRVRAGATNPRELEGFGLLHIGRSWYINGPVMDQFTISTLMGPVQVPAGTRIISEELPEQWEANGRPSDPGKQQWFAYSNGRTGFC